MYGKQKKNRRISCILLEVSSKLSRSLKIATIDQLLTLHLHTPLKTTGAQTPQVKIRSFVRTDGKLVGLKSRLITSKKGHQL
ncbi:hypothetical protein PGT21_030349 [Puccinia graminis f. sp. tritici]|uniref:Uncharacterized protein n=1 Tax=Puccinia graminis f. sp. tritici TaxID=56615 RepID=A0A5B0QP91_PUCGR|nr:hypothetical protein PGT21_030349 [Puccinia graminis f. sp. tritici]